MATFHIANFGCRATQADAAAIERQLLARGCAPSAQAAEADVVVINTCTVTANADSQARQAIRRFHAQNPQARILVTGCYAQRAPEELAQIAGVSWVVGNAHKPEIGRLLECGGLTPLSSGQACTRGKPTAAFLPMGQIAGMKAHSLAAGPAKILIGDISAQTEVLVAPVFENDADPSALLGAAHTRPILKIQDGCDSRCTYCVIPFVRGRSRSLAPARVVAEILQLTGAGYQEIVLSGINLGSYGRDLSPRVALLDLLRRILDQTPLARPRLSSIEPQDVTQELVDLVAASNRIARHFHIPLQSGSDRILAAMRRWYRAAHYARKIELIHERIPAAAIGADVMAGFPGESEDDHRATMDFIARLPFSYLHVFSFSKRPGTAAENLPDEIPPHVIKRRSRELRALAEEKKAAFRASQVGSTLRVLTLGVQGFGDAQGRDRLQPVRTSGDEDGALAPEVPQGPWTAAISDNYLSLRIPGHHPRNQFLVVQVATDGAHLPSGVANTAKVENRN